jgi:putative ABC transport system permease protein
LCTFASTTAELPANHGGPIRGGAEIGVRKAMGAGTAELMRMLVWQSTQPVLWANLIAWPLGALVMHRWLQGFACHVERDPLWFAAASAIALTLALFTVSAHCYRVARERPVKALRYE